jgi:hypothetical protein
MSFESLDDPALVLPRVGDVHGTLLRLGFTGYTAKGMQFYRQFVPLFEGGVKAQFVSRNISHVSIVIVLTDDPAMHGKVWLKYGYPERYTRGKKIIEGFKPLSSEETYLTIDFHPDWALREAEKSLSFLIDSIKTKRIDMTMDADSEHGLVKKDIPPWEAVVYAVQQTLNSKGRIRCTGEWWIEPEPHEQQPDFEKLSLRRIGKGRLPNFDRRRLDLRQVVLRQSGIRPRNVNRRNG